MDRLSVRCGTWILVAVAASWGALAKAATVGYVDDFVQPGTAGWGGGPAPTNPGTGGVDGAGDGYLKIAQGFTLNFGARTAMPAYSGNWTTAGITEVSLWLNDIGAPDPLEIHLLISDGSLSTTWMYLPGFKPPHNCWKQFHVDLTDPSKWIAVRGTSAFADVLRSVERITLRHDLAPYEEFPNTLAGDLGVDNITLGPLPSTCADPFADADADGDVDQEDFGFFQVCFAGECTVRAGECACMDRDRDGDVDLNDFGAFQACISGPLMPADRSCDD